MSQLNSQWQQKLAELTQKYQLSEPAIMVLLQALIKGNCYATAVHVAACTSWKMRTPGLSITPM